MLKIPTFILGGLLILTGLGSYLLQDLGVSIKLSGPLAENAKLTLSDGEESHELDLGYPSSKAAGEQAYWLIERLNTRHSIKASQSNFIADQSSEGGEKKSFWYASSRKETMTALIQDASNYKNANDSSFESIPVNWEEVDVNSSTVKFVYKNEAGNSGPVTLKVSNWKNINMENPPEDNTLEFGKSLTALIPGAIGLVLILLVLGAEAKPGARKHIMHLAVLFGLLGFVMVARQVGSAVAEMNWLRDEPNGIIQASSLKPTVMLISAGLLLIFVILCIVSFVKARKEMAYQAKINKVKAQKEEKAEEDKLDDPPSKDSKEKIGQKEDDKEKKDLKHPEKRDKTEAKKNKSSEGSDSPSKAKDLTDSKSKGSSEHESSDSSKEKSSSESEEQKKNDSKKQDSVSHGYKPVDSPKGKLKKDNENSPDPADKPKEDTKDSPNHSADAPGTGSPSDSGKEADQSPEKKTDEDSGPVANKDSKEEENSSEDKPKDENRSDSDPA